MEDLSPKNLANIAGPSQSIPATKDNKPSAGAVVDHPRDVDVVGTRRRTWSQHPGNVYFRDLVCKTLEELLEKSENTPMKFWATKIVDRIMNERDAVFLKADEQNGRWIVMDYAAAVNKSAVAIRNAEIKQRGALTKKKIAKRKSGGGTSSAKVLSNPSGTTHVQDLPPIHYNEGPPPEKIIYRCIYEVKEGAAVSLDPYVKAIINLMCAQFSSKAASRALDAPIAFIYKTAEEEPDKQRLLRLQLRQRYIAAMTVGVSPVFFSKKLMELWGGSISDYHVRIDKKGNIIDEVPPVPAVASAATVINPNKKETQKEADEAEKTTADASSSAVNPTFPNGIVQQLDKKLNEAEGSKLGGTGDVVVVEKTIDSSSQNISSATMAMVERKHKQGNIDDTSCSQVLVATKGDQTEKEGKGDSEQDNTIMTAKMDMGEGKYDQENKEVTTNLEKALAVADAAIDLEEALAALNVTASREGALVAAAQQKEPTENEVEGATSPAEAVTAKTEDQSERIKDASNLEAAAAAVLTKEEKNAKDVKYDPLKNEEAAVAASMTVREENQTKHSNDEFNVKQVEAANVVKKEEKTEIDGKDTVTQDENKALVKAETTATDGNNAEAKPEDPSSVKEQAERKAKVEGTPPFKVQEENEEELASAVEKKDDTGNNDKEKVEDEPSITKIKEEKQEAPAPSQKEQEHDNDKETAEKDPSSAKVEEKEEPRSQEEDDKEEVKVNEEWSVKMEEGKERSRSNMREKQNANKGQTVNSKAPVKMEEEEKEECPRSTRKRRKQEDNDEVKPEDTSLIKTEEDATMEGPRSTRVRKKFGDADSIEKPKVEKQSPVKREEEAKAFESPRSTRRRKKLEDADKMTRKRSRR